MNDGIERYQAVVARAEKAEADLDIARATVAELVEAIESCTEWMRSNPPVNGWGLLDRAAEADCSEVLAKTDAALAKAKGGTNG